MARKKTIGILNAIVTADAAQLRKEFASVDNTVRRSTTGWQRQLKGGLKLGAGIVGAQAGIGALVGEIQRVIANVENIPGINPQAVASIVEARTEFAKFRNTIDSGIASALSFGAQFAKAIGAGAAMLAGASGEDVAAGLAKLETPDEIAAAKDDQYYDKVAAARTRLNEVKKAGIAIGTTEVNQINELRAQAAAYDKFAESSSITTLQAFEARTKAQELFNQAKQKEYSLGEKLNQVQEQVAAVWHENSLVGKRDAQTLNALNERRIELLRQIGQMNLDRARHGTTPENLQAVIDKEKELLQVEKDRGQVLKAQDRAFRQLGESVADSFESAVVSGGSLREILQGIESDLIRIAFRKAITEPLGNWLGGGLKSIFGGFFAEGGRPPMGKVSIVGEDGPELFVPDTAGTIVPSHKVADGGKGGGTFYIDARGADRTGMARLEAMIRSVNGSIEHRALGVVMDFRRRGATA